MEWIIPAILVFLILIVAARARWQTARSTRQKICMNKKREGRPLYSRPPFLHFIR